LTTVPVIDVVPPGAATFVHSTVLFSAGWIAIVHEVLAGDGSVMLPVCTPPQFGSGVALALSETLNVQSASSDGLVTKDGEMVADWPGFRVVVLSETALCTPLTVAVAVTPTSLTSPVFVTLPVIVVVPPGAVTFVQCTSVFSEGEVAIWQVAEAVSVTTQPVSVTVPVAVTVSVDSQGGLAGRTAV
jgi:hypothetical protein